jgi:tetratricopeptide (TPR) repeat protein
LVEAALAFEAAGPEVCGALGALPGAVWLQLGDFSEALRLLSPLAEQAPEDGQVVMAAGQAAYRLRHYAEAVRLWDRLARVDPELYAQVELKHGRARRLGGRP